MTRTSIASRFVLPAGLALSALMLVASPVGLGKTGLVLQSAKAETSVDTSSPDSSTSGPDRSTDGADKSSNGASGGAGVGGNAGTNSGSHDGGSSGGGSHDGAGDR